MGEIMRATSIAIMAAGLLIAPCGIGQRFARAADSSSREVSGPLSPAESQRQFVLPKGLKIELVAAEPDVQSPVAMAFDQNGRMFVVEMLDYPNGPPPGSPPEGRIRLLEDRDGTGRFRPSRLCR